MGNLINIFSKTLENLVSEFDGVFYHSQSISLQEFIDESGLKIEAKDFFSDGIHPSKLAYQIWAKDVAQYIMQTDQIKLSVKEF